MASKVIKVEETVYDQLDKLRGRGETFSQIVGELLEIRTGLFHLLDNTEETLKFRDWQRDQVRLPAGQIPE